MVKHYSSAIIREREERESRRLTIAKHYKIKFNVSAVTYMHSCDVDITLVCDDTFYRVMMKYY